jgi:hypothetical protein
MVFRGGVVDWNLLQGGVSGQITETAELLVFHDGSQCRESRLPALPALSPGTSAGKWSARLFG